MDDWSLLAQRLALRLGRGLTDHEIKLLRLLIKIYGTNAVLAEIEQVKRTVGRPLNYIASILRAKAVREQLNNLMQGM